MLFGLVVGAIAIALVALAVIVFAPSRRVRNEPPLPMPTQLEILLRGRELIDHDIAADSPWQVAAQAPTRPEDPAWQFDTAELTSLGNLADVVPDVPAVDPDAGSGARANTDNDR